jgi:hypothetical protein
LGETGSDQPSQELGNILQQTLVCCRVSLTFGAHGFGPKLFADLHVFSFCADANVTYA